MLFLSRFYFYLQCVKEYNYFIFCINSLFSIPTCFVCSAVLGYVWLCLLEKPNADLVPNYSYGVIVVLICVLIEMLADPVYVFSQSYHFVKLKVMVISFVSSFYCIICKKLNFFPMYNAFIGKTVIMGQDYS